MWFDNRNGIRKRVAVLIMTVFCVLAAAFPAALRADAQGSAKITASVCTARRGDTVTIALTLEDNPGIWGLKLRAEYDHAALSLLSVENGGMFSDSEAVWPQESGERTDSQKYVFLACADQLENNTKNGDVVTLMFSVAKGAPAGEYPVALEVVQAINADGEEVSVAVQNGAVTVKMDAPAPPEGITAKGCTDSNENDGVIFGVDSSMEYQKEGEAQWISISGDSIHGLTSGTYYIRKKETETAMAGRQTSVTVEGYEEDEPVVETADQKTADSQKTATGTKTGDKSNPALWIVLELLSAGIMAAVILSRRTENSRKQDRSS